MPVTYVITCAIRSSSLTGLWACWPEHYPEESSLTIKEQIGRSAYRFPFYPIGRYKT